MKKELKAVITGILLTIVMALLFFGAVIFFASCDSTKGEWDDMNDPNTYWNKTIGFDGTLEVGSTVKFWIYMPPEFNHKKRWHFWTNTENVRNSWGDDTVYYKIKRTGDLSVLVDGYNADSTQILHSFLWHRKISK